MSDNNDQLPFELPIPVGIEDEMKRSYLDYAMSVIIGRTSRMRSIVGSWSFIFVF